MTLALLESFVPIDIVRDLEESARADAGWRRVREEAAVVFADVSGFSQLADSLFRRFGARGGELLTDMLTQFFGHLVELTRAHHGEIVKWSGDAFLAVWREHEHEGRAVARAAACARELTKHTLTPEQTTGITLRVRAALTHGELVTAKVGGVDDHWEIVVGGAPIRQISAALAAAPPSSVVLSPEARARLGRDGRGTLLDGGHLLLAEAPAAPAHRPKARRALTDDDLGLLRGLVPEAVRRRVESGLDDWFSESRYVSSVFILARGLDPETDEDVGRLHRAVEGAQQIFARHGGVLAQAGADDKGVWLLGGFGLPSTTSDDPVRGALLASLEVSEALSALGVRASGGIASGRAFCGWVGSRARREFTFTSRVVTLSARLMSRIEHGVLVDAATAERARGAVTLVERAPEAVRGFEEPVVTFELRGLARATTDDGASGEIVELAGRTEERARFTQALATLDERGRRCVLLEGEPGIGKSTLLNEVTREVRDRARVLRGAADRRGSTTPYSAFRAIFASLLGTPLEVDGEADRRRVEQRLLATHPELLEQAALLNGILPVRFEDRAETATLSGQARAESTRRLLLSILEQAAIAGPLVLVLEDVHWLDGLSWKLLVTATNELEPLVVLLSMRPMERPPEERARLLELPWTDHIALAPLTADEVGIMVGRFLGQAPPPHLAEWLIRRAGGNPFFVHELFATLVADGHVEVVEGQHPKLPTPSQLESVAVPADVESVVTSRIDRLAPDLQLVLKTASVVGPTFEVDSIASALPTAAAAPRVDAILSELEDTELVARSGTTWRFTHETLQRVAYEQLSSAQRVSAHRALAEHYEVRHVGDPAFVGAIAHHWDQTAEHVRAVDALERAAKHAMRSGAFHEADHFYARAQSRVESESSVEVLGERRAEWSQHRAEASFQLGRIRESCEQGEQSLGLLGRRVPSNRAGWSWLALSQLALQAWQRWTPKRAGSGHASTRTMLTTAGRLAEAYVFANRPLEMLALALWSANQAPRAGRGAALAQHYAMLGLTAGMARWHRGARRYFELAHEASDASGVPSDAIGSLFLEALYRQGSAELEAWRAVLDRAWQTAVRAQNDHQADMLRMGVAMHEWHCGRFHGSLRVVEETRASAARRYDEQLAGWCDLSSASCHERLGNFEQALRYLDRSAKVLERLGDHAIQSNFDGLRCLLTYRLGDRATTRRLAPEILSFFAKSPPTSGMAITAYHALAVATSSLYAEARAAGEVDAELEGLATRAVAESERFGRLFKIGRASAHLHRGRFLAIEGDIPRALTEWGQALDLAVASGLPWEEGTARAFLAQHGPVEQRPVHLERARTIFRDSGASFDLAALDAG